MAHALASPALMLAWAGESAAVVVSTATATAAARFSLVNMSSLFWLEQRLEHAGGLEDRVIKDGPDAHLADVIHAPAVGLVRGGLRTGVLPAQAQ